MATLMLLKGGLMSPRADELLRALAQNAQRLNSEAEQLSQRIVQLEKQVSALQIGLPVWLPAAVTDPTADQDAEDDARSWDLGYQRLSGAWRIAVRPRWSTTIARPDGSSHEEYSVGEALPLLKAPRGVRHRAEDRLEDLLEQLDQAIDELIGPDNRAYDYGPPPMTDDDVPF